MGFDTISIYPTNDSGYTFQPSGENAPILRGCSLQSLDAELQPIAAGSRYYAPYTELKLNEGETVGSGLLRFDIVDSDWILGLWFWMKPATWEVEVKTGLFTKEKPINANLHDQLAAGDRKPHELGFDDNIVWKLVTGNTNHILGVKTVMDVKLVPVERDDYWNYGKPVKVDVFIGSTLKPPQVEKKKESTLAYKVSAGLNQAFGDPVHENMTLAALIVAGILPSDTAWDKVVGRWSKFVGQPDVFEFIRGVIWNDDPACALFNEDENNNGNYAWGLDFGYSFASHYFWNLFADQIITRSHFGDLQFLHSMGSKPGEPPHETKEKIMLWLETMYKLACGGQGVEAHQRIDSRLGSYFNDNTVPKGSDSFKDLLLGKTRKYQNVIIERRALGSCFHVIQDSYAVGHCQRRIVNPEEKIIVKPSLVTRFLSFVNKALVPGGGIPEPAVIFKHIGRFDEVLNFHSYDGQDSHRHDLYDQPNGSMTAGDLESFNKVVGARDAIDKCAQLARFWAEKTKWEDGVGDFLRMKVFSIHEKATGSNIDVDDVLRKE